MTAPEFVAESIEMKMRWLARQLRLTDTTADIELWVKAITLLENLLLRLHEDCKRKTISLAANGTQPRKRSCFTISAPCSTDFKDSEFGNDNMVSLRTSTEVGVSECKLEKNKGTETQVDGREAKRRKIGSINEDEPVETVDPTDQMRIDDECVHPTISPISDNCWETREGAGNSVEELIHGGGVDTTDIEGTEKVHPEVKDNGAISQMVLGGGEWSKKRMSKEKQNTEQVQNEWWSNVTSRLEGLEGPLGYEIKNKLEIWRRGMLRRLQEQKEVEDLGDIYGTQFTELCCYSASEDLKNKVMKYIGQEPVREYLFGEMTTFINQRTT